MQTETPQPPARRRVPPAVALPLIGLAALGVAYVAARPLGGEPRPSFYVIGSARPGVQVGQLAPGTAESAGDGMTLTDLEGAPVRLADFDGSPVWVVFWKESCPPCEAEAPDVAAAYAAHRADGLVLLGIDVWDSVTSLSDYARAHPLAFPVVVDATGRFISAYGVWGAPTHYFIGADGTIRDRYFGPMTPELIDKSLATILSAAGT